MAHFFRSKSLRIQFRIAFACSRSAKIVGHLATQVVCSRDQATYRSVEILRNWTSSCEHKGLCGRLALRCAEGDVPLYSFFLFSFSLFFLFVLLVSCSCYQYNPALLLHVRHLSLRCKYQHQRNVGHLEPHVRYSRYQVTYEPSPSSSSSSPVC